MIKTFCSQLSPVIEKKEKVISYLNQLLSCWRGFQTSGLVQRNRFCASRSSVFEVLVPTSGCHPQHVLVLPEPLPRRGFRFRFLFFIDFSKIVKRARISGRSYISTVAMPATSAGWLHGKGSLLNWVPHIRTYRWSYIYVNNSYC